MLMKFIDFIMFPNILKQPRDAMLEGPFKDSTAPSRWQCLEKLEKYPLECGIYSKSASYVCFFHRLYLLVINQDTKPELSPLSITPNDPLIKVLLYSCEHSFCWSISLRSEGKIVLLVVTTILLNWKLKLMPDHLVFFVLLIEQIQVMTFSGIIHSTYKGELASYYTVGIMRKISWVLSILRSLLVLLCPMENYHNPNQFRHTTNGLNPVGTKIWLNTGQSTKTIYDT